MDAELRPIASHAVPCRLVASHAVPCRLVASHAMPRPRAPPRPVPIPPPPKTQQPMFFPHRVRAGCCQLVAAAAAIPAGSGRGDHLHESRKRIAPCRLQRNGAVLAQHSERVGTCNAHLQVWGVKRGQTRTGQAALRWLRTGSECTPTAS
eukprot:364686-Chlamydomonas_euryale.AAC.6